MKLEALIEFIATITVVLLPSGTMRPIEPSLSIFATDPAACVRQAAPKALDLVNEDIGLAVYSVNCIEADTAGGQ